LAKAILCAVLFFMLLLHVMLQKQSQWYSQMVATIFKLYHVYAIQVRNLQRSTNYIISFVPTCSFDILFRVYSYR